MTEIDFLPAEYWKRRASQRDQWYLLAIGAASLILLLARFVHESNNAAQLRTQLESVESEYKDMLVLLEEVKRLEDMRAPLALDAKFYSLLRARPSLSRAMVALATSCPTRLTLSTIRMKTVTAARSEQKEPGAGGRATSTSGAASVDPLVEQFERFATQREFSRVTIELSGVAESDLELAEFMERLENAGCFTEVALNKSADSPTAGVSDLREFTLQCRLVEIF